MHDDDVDLPSFAHLLLVEGLYHRPYDLMGDWSYVKRLIAGPPLQFDAYCVRCKDQSTFRLYQGTRGGGAGMPSIDDQAFLEDRLINLTFQCQRNSNHEYVYLLRVDRQALQKIRQGPSLADIATADIARFRSVLDDKYLHELKSAIGLFAHGVGIGSFTYLRQIFEKLISDERDSARVEGEKLEGFETARLEDKIEMLKGRLPVALVQYKSVYPFLSAGIHDLDEKPASGTFLYLRRLSLLS